MPAARMTTEIALDFPLRTELWRLHRASLRGDGFPFAYLLFEREGGGTVHVRLDLQKRVFLDQPPDETVLSHEDARRLSRQIIDALKHVSAR
jgi:hypothetical protein